MIPILLIITGLIVGLISSFFGIGGGIIAVPIFYSIFPTQPPQVIVASSLGIILLNSLLNSYNYRKLGIRPALSMIIPIGLTLTLGIFTGGKVSFLIPENSIKIIFAIFLLLMAIKMSFFTPVPHAVSSESDSKEQFSFPLSIIVKSSLITFFGGIIAGLVGIGGGVIIIPTLMTIAKLPMRIIPAYSNLVMAIGASGGVLTYMLTSCKNQLFQDEFFKYLQVGYLNWGIVLLTFMGAFFSSKLGAKLSQKTGQKLASRLLALILVIFSVKISLSVYL